MKYIQLFLMVACLTACQTPSVDASPEPTLPPVADRPEQGSVPAGYIQYCEDFPSSVLCEQP